MLAIVIPYYKISFEATLEMSNDAICSLYWDGQSANLTDLLKNIKENLISYIIEAAHEKRTKTPTTSCHGM
jgi:hypothetical protein